MGFTSEKGTEVSISGASCHSGGHQCGTRQVVMPSSHPLPKAGLLHSAGMPGPVMTRKKFCWGFASVPPKALQDQLSILQQGKDPPKGALRP